MATLGLSKVFILDKYFTELQKFWETEKKLQDASSSNEAVHLQQRLRSLSTELVTLRNRLHVSQPNGAPAAPNAPAPPGHHHHHQHPGGAAAAQHHGGTPLHQPHQIVHHAAIGIHLANADDPKSRLHLSGGGGGVRGGGPLMGRPSPAMAPTSPPGGTGPLASHLHHQGQHCAAPNAGGQRLSANAAQPSVSTADIEDLIHLPGPLTEDAVIRCLHSRFLASQFYTNVGPILVCLNNRRDDGNPLTLSSTRSIPLDPKLSRVVTDAVRQQSETGYPQAIILSGSSGSGKTYTSMLVLRQLFEVAGGGPETDAFKHLAAAFTVLRSLGSARTASNPESSRIGHFIEVQVTDGSLYRTKIHCYFLDQTRVVRPLDSSEKNYHIFYQMLAGLTDQEREKLGLQNYGIHNLRYLNRGNTSQDEAKDAARFLAWRACLGILGIPFLEVVRVLSAVLLLGNIQFVEGSRAGGAGSGEELLASVASLLGVAPDALMQGLTMRTRNVRGQLVRTNSDADVCNFTRDSLAKALYCRTVATIVRRANSLKRPLGSTSGTLSSDSNDSVHNQAAEVSSQHASTIGTAGSKSSKSMVALNNAVRHATHGFIGILDMFGFEDPKPSQLEHLCINLCAETMQHFYNTHVFKSSIESCRDEGIQCSVQADYVDNVPCIDLISSLRTGLLSMLDVECSVRGTPESYVQKVRVQHRHNPRLVAEVSMNNSQGRGPQHHMNGYQYGQQSQQHRHSINASSATCFAIRHFAGTVVYDSANFLETNRDVVPDDLVSVFHRHHCNFGFATHLFGSELKALSTSTPHIIPPAMTPPAPSSHQQAGAIMPRGVAFRISPTSHTDLQNGDEPVSTLTQDFHTRLDNLLRTLVHARPHFVRCIRADEDGTGSSANSTYGGNPNEEFARQAVRRQIRSLQILETVNLMAGGFPHRMRFKAFNNRYRSLAPSHCLRSTGQRPCAPPIGGDGGNGGQQEGAEMCMLILQCFQQALLIAGSSAGQQAQQHIARCLILLNTLISNPSQQLGKGLSLGMIAAGSGLIPMSNVSTAWATGKRHIFLSEGARQQLEAMRWERLRRAAVTIQSTWRGWHFRRRRWPTLRITLGDVRQRVTPQTGGSSQPPSQPPPPPPPPTQLGQIGAGLACPTTGKGAAAAARANAVSGGGGGKLTAASGAAGVGASQGGSLSRPRPQPISGTPPPLDESGAGGNGAGAPGGNGAGGGALATGVEKCDHKMIQQTCSLFGLDLERPPPVPPSRSYTVAGNTKLGYPQTRVMKMSFSDESAVGSGNGDVTGSTLHKGESVVVIGASPRRGHLLVEHNTCTLHVPYQYLELKAAVGAGQAQAAGVNI
ncbi:unconventional myosin-Ia [Ischnura elegans]|uniref:unconventional myosin-Ia n=1 Tax=Ischnura elegans TaxID=197161 RepID=UPI001ED8BA9C|nr:unconventional myosin-Ia [Ischnura elegans]